MPRLPMLTPTNTSRVMTDTWRGYNHNIKILDGELYDDENLTTDYYPVLGVRKPRGLVKTLTNPGGLMEKDALCYVANGTLYVNDLPTALTGLSNGEKQLVSMGAYIVIFPDKRYYNTEDPSDFGYMEADWSITGEIQYAPCDIDGNIYEVVSSPSEPVRPENGTYWLDTTTHTMQQYSASLGTWAEVATAYTKVSFPSQGQIPAIFKQGDGVIISGAAFDDLNGVKYLYAVGGEENVRADYIVLVGLVGSTQVVEGTLSVQRKLPDMDYVVECQNRLWGCCYGNAGGKNVNELYCSALGDFKNWRQYQGLSTDSWAASVGSDGQWTGAVNYLGHPCFFKENRIHTVTVSPSGAHRVEETVCRGVQKDSHKSLRVVGETLFYKSRTDVCSWQGGFPAQVSMALGETKYTDAVAGAYGTKYYISMKDEHDAWQLFVYDSSKGFWIREDNLHVTSFAKVDDELYAIDADNNLLALLGTKGTLDTVDWSMETGLLYYEYPDKKYVSRYDIRLRMDEGATANIFIQYDASGTWEANGTLHRTYTGTGTVTMPIRPRRCDTLKMKISGSGRVKILSIARTLEVGSDV